ncbi:MAG TPA: hypothetical protein VE263_07815, partial [Candidatus Angelobacter sp.]|nr:hypothetical protein [Candidatus Angelobacter sp.]
PSTTTARASWTTWHSIGREPAPCGFCATSAHAYGYPRHPILGLSKSSLEQDEGGAPEFLEIVMPWVAAGAA